MVRAAAGDYTAGNLFFSSPPGNRQSPQLSQPQLSDPIRALGGKISFILKRSLNTVMRHVTTLQSSQDHTYDSHPTLGMCKVLQKYLPLCHIACRLQPRHMLHRLIT